MRMPCVYVVAGVCAVAALGAQTPKSSAATGLIVGIVVDAATGKPVSGAIVSISSSAPASPVGREPPAALPRILTGADGRFVCRDLPVGNYNITATRAGYADGAYGRRRPGGPSVALALADGEKTADAVVRIWKFAAISGTVLDEAGEPVVGARVRSWRRAFERGRYSFVPSTVAGTDDRGIYRLGGLIPGDYVVGVPALQVPGLSSDAELLTSSLEVTPSVGFNGAWTRIGPNLDVLLRGAPVPPPPADGRLSLYPTTWHPSASSSAEAASITVMSGQERGGIDIQLHPVRTVRVSGTVTRADGPVTSIPINLVPAGDEIEAVGFSGGADGNGSFIFPAVPAGQYTLRVAGTLSVNEKLIETLWSETALTVGESDVDNVAVTIGPGLRINGRLEFDGSKPGPSRVDRVPLLVESVDRRFTFRSSPVIVDAGGQFGTGGYPPGRYFVRVSGSPIGWMFKSATYGGRDVSETPIELVDEDVHVVLTYTDRWTGLAGTVNTADGRPDADAIVLVFPTDSKLWVNYGATPRRLKSARTRKTGDYNFNSLPPGTYHVVALPDAQAADWMDPAFLAAVSRAATQITIGEAEQKTSNLRTQVIR